MILNRIILATLLLSVSLVNGSQNQDTVYSAQEKAALVKFREAVKGVTYLDYQNEDIYLIRWLRAKGLDVSKAKEMLIKSIEWRKKNDIDNIANDKSMLKLLKAFPSTNHAVDKDGRPVFQTFFGIWDIRKQMLAGNQALLGRYTSFHFEKMVGLVRAADKAPTKDVSQWIFLVDMNGYSARQHACLACVPFYLDLVNMYEANYPNTARYIILVNTPRLFDAMLQLMRPLMSAATRRDMQVFGTDKQEWEPVLLGIMPADQLTLIYPNSHRKQA